MYKKLYFIAIALNMVYNISAQTFDTRKLDQYFDAIEKGNKGLGSIAISVNNHLEYTRTLNKVVGYTEKFTGNKYHIGSITKMLTAVLILQLVEENKISLNEKLDKYFPEIINASHISVDNLLSHTSGLKDFVENTTEGNLWLTKQVTESEILEEIKRQGVAFNPGERVEYSNSGYYLLVKILEKKYGLPYRDILYKKIVTPLHLKNTWSIANNDSKTEIASSYSWENGWDIVEDFYFPNIIGVGDVVSTPEDLNKILNALVSKKLINGDNFEKMIPLHNRTYGRGLMRFAFSGYMLYGHSGDTVGTHAVTAINLKDNIAITLIINGQVLSLNEYFIAVLSIIYGKEYTIPDFTTIKFEKTLLEKFEGLYYSVELPFKIKIFLQGNQLKAQADGQPSFSLQQYDNNKFEFLPAEIKIEFLQENKMMLTQSGESVILVRE